MNSAKSELQNAEKELEENKKEFNEKINDAEQKLIDARQKISEIENPEWYILDSNSVSNSIFHCCNFNITNIYDKNGRGTKSSNRNIKSIRV